MNELFQKHKRPLIVMLVALEFVFGFISLSMGPVSLVRADFGVPADTDCQLHNITLLGLNDVDGNAVYWNAPGMSTYEVPTGDKITGVNITVFTDSGLVDAYYKVACDILILDPSNHELLNETVKSMDWAKTGYLDGSIYVTYLNLASLDILLEDVGVYSVLIVLYYLE